MDEARTIRDLLHRYELASGQQVNVAKTNVSFSKGTSSMRRDEVIITLNVQEVLAYNKYLGLPTRMGRSKKKALMSLKDRISKKINGWMGRNLSWTGREVLVKVVAQTIPTYTMSIFSFPKDFCLNLQALINRYWWGQKKGKKKIHWVARE